MTTGKRKVSQKDAGAKVQAAQPSDNGPDQAPDQADDENAVKLARLTENLKKIEELSLRLTGALAAQKAHDTALDGPGQELMMQAAAAYLSTMMQNPSKII